MLDARGSGPPQECDATGGVPPHAPPCGDGVCLFARADADASGCIDYDEASKLLGALDAVVDWARRVQSTASCWEAGVQCMDYWQTESLALCVYDSAVAFMYE